jgi:hypothetical protein
MNIIKNKAEIILEAGKETVLEVNIDTSKYMNMK